MISYTERYIYGFINSIMTINCNHINLSIYLISNQIPIKFFTTVENLSHV